LDDWPILVLPRTRLRLKRGYLIKESKDGDRLAQLPLARIQDIRIVSVFEPIGLVFSLICLGLAVVCRIYLGSGFWGWSLAVLFAGGFIFCALMMRKKQICIESVEGIVHYDIDDMEGEAEGFVVSVKEWKQTMLDAAGSPSPPTDAEEA
jgi:hypothetical protein